MRESILNISQTYGLKPTHVRFEPTFSYDNESLKSKLTDLPKGN